MGSLLAAALATTAALADAPAVAAPTPNAIVYVQSLPSPAELSKAAAAQGLSIAQINQTSDQVTVVYKSASGETNTIAYRPLSAVGAAPAAATTSQTVVVPSTPAPSTTVVYSTPVYTYDPYWYPGWGWYPPVAVSLGFGWHGGGWGWRR